MEAVDEEFLVSRSDEAPAALQRRFQEHGYLYFQRYVAAGQCESLLRNIMGQLVPHLAFDQQGQHPVLAAQPFFETDPVWDEVYPKIQALEEFHNFFHEPRILSLMKTVVDKTPFVYPMKMARISTPGKIGYETPPHQDAHSHNAGPTMAGIWVALHDVSKPMGRVKVLAGSHRRGVRRVFAAEGVGGVQCEIFPWETTWHVSDFRRGDVLVFHSCAIHKAEPNTAQQAARISVDTRFCDFGAPVFSTNLEPHHGWRIQGLDWESIYRGWQHQDNQYYWADYPNLF